MRQRNPARFRRVYLADRGRRLLLALILLALLSLLLAPLPAARAADELDSCQGTVENARKVVVHCRPGFATDSDQVTVYLGQDLPPGALWQDGLNMTNAVWLFDAGSQGRNSLAIDFHQDGRALVADIFDDGNRNGAVSVEISEKEGERPRITENVGLPTIRMTAPDGWWVREGRINFNLDIRVDGPVQGMMDTGQYQNRLRTDTRADLEIFVRDPQNSGRPQYEWRQAYPPGQREDGYYRTVVNANPHNNEVPLSEYWIWPYLKAGPPTDGWVKGYRVSPPPIQVDWPQARVVILGEFVASRGSTNWFLNSIKRVGVAGEWPGLSSDLANFETPFAYYDFARRNDGFPDTVVRFSYRFPNDPYFRRGSVGNGVEQIDYSWMLRRTVNEPVHPLGPHWDYKVSLAGIYTQQGNVQLPDFNVRMIPYEQIPRWVVDKTWHTATFVARENEGYPSSEGLYEWYPLEGAEPEGWAYIAGVEDEPPAQSAQDGLAPARTLQPLPSNRLRKSGMRSLRGLPVLARPHRRVPSGRSRWR